MALNSVCITPHPQSYRARNYKPRKPIDLLLMSSRSKISNSTKSFACKVHN